MKYLFIMSMIIVLRWVCFSQPSQKSSKDLQAYESLKSPNQKAVSLRARAMDSLKSGGISVHSRKFKYEKALELLDSAIAADSTYYNIYEEKAKILCGLNRKADAISTLEKKIQIHPKYMDYLMLGVIYESMNDMKTADSCYRSGLALNLALSSERHELFIRGDEISFRMFLRDTTSVSHLLNKLKVEYPNNEKEIEFYHEMVTHFNRDQFMKEVFR